MTQEEKQLLHQHFAIEFEQGEYIEVTSKDKQKTANNFIWKYLKN